MLLLRCLYVVVACASTHVLCYNLPNYKATYNNDVSSDTENSKRHVTALSPPHTTNERYTINNRKIMDLTARREASSNPAPQMRWSGRLAAQGRRRHDPQQEGPPPELKHYRSEHRDTIQRTHDHHHRQQHKQSSEHDISGENLQPHGVVPPDVCDLCPVAVSQSGYTNPLYPCTCVGNSGSAAGDISIACPNSTASTDQLKDIFSHTAFLTPHVFRLTLEDSEVTGVLSQDLWGPLDFVQVLITGNKVQHVDNQAFVQSAKTLSLLNLDNNEIQSYVTTGVDDLPKLQTLVLKRNRLSFIATNAFNYTSLKVLDLSYNTISSIGKNSFAALNKLEELSLDHNLLTSVDDECFKFFHHSPDSMFLQLDLSYNQISYISNTGFEGLKNVEIDLRNNRLTTVAETIFLPIIIDSHFFAYFEFSENQVNCDCQLLWIVEDSSLMGCFDNFSCANNVNLTLYALTPSDLGNCTVTLQS